MESSLFFCVGGSCLLGDVFCYRLHAPLSNDGWKDVQRWPLAKVWDVISIRISSRRDDTFLSYQILLTNPFCMINIGSSRRLMMVCFMKVNKFKYHTLHLTISSSIVQCVSLYCFKSIVTYCLVRSKGLVSVPLVAGEGILLFLAVMSFSQQASNWKIYGQNFQVAFDASEANKESWWRVHAGLMLGSLAVKGTLGWENEIT